jgi:hypothetical protein
MKLNLSIPTIDRGDLAFTGIMLFITGLFLGGMSVSYCYTPTAIQWVPLVLITLVPTAGCILCGIAATLSTTLKWWMKYVLIGIAFLTAWTLLSLFCGKLHISIPRLPFMRHIF